MWIGPDQRVIISIQNKNPEASKAPIFNVLSVTGFLVDITSKVLSRSLRNFVYRTRSREEVITCWEQSGT